MGPSVMFIFVMCMLREGLTNNTNFVKNLSSSKIYCIILRWWPEPPELPLWITMQVCQVKMLVISTLS